MQTHMHNSLDLSLFSDHSKSLLLIFLPPALGVLNQVVKELDGGQVSILGDPLVNRVEAQGFSRRGGQESVQVLGQSPVMPRVRVGKHSRGRNDEIVSKQASKGSTNELERTRVARGDGGGFDTGGKSREAECSVGVVSTRGTVLVESDKV